MKINVRINKPKKVNILLSKKSAFVSFEYNYNLKEFIKKFDYWNYNPDTKEWEIQESNVKHLVDVWSKYAKIDIVDETPEEIPHIEKTIPKDYKFYVKPMQHQLEAINFGLNHSNFILADEMGLGKALSLDTKIYTPDGFKLMKDISVGDIVFGRDGKPTKVLEVYDHKNVDMYKITFVDGVEIKCCKDHLWKIYDQHGSKIVPTQWFLEKDQFGKIRKDHLVNKNSIYKYWIDKCQPVQFNNQPLPTIHPYVLGCILGDGCISTNACSINNPDKEIIDKISTLLPPNYIIYHRNSGKQGDYNIINKFNINKKATHRNDILYQLRELNLLYTNSHTKFIPKEYLYNSVENRLALLRGLIDTDGYTSNQNLIQYYTVSKQLMEDVRFLVESLGGFVSLSTKIGKIYGIEKSLCYILTIKIDDPTILCSLNRKKKNLSIRKFKPKREIIKIEKIPNEDAKCIKVDNEEHLYLIDHFIVTHNTFSAAHIANIETNAKVLIICCGCSLKENWKEDLKKNLNENAFILTGSNKDKLNQLENIDTINEKYIITNLETLRGLSYKEKFEGRKREKLRLPIAEKLKELCDNGIIDTIIVDEFHRGAKDIDSQNAQGLLMLNSKYKIGLSGTPILNKPFDILVILTWLGYNSMNKWQFEHHFGIWGGYCVCGDTKISTYDGTKSIKSIYNNKNEIVKIKSKNITNNDIEYLYMNNIIKYKDKKQILLLEIQDNNKVYKLKLTKDHRVYTNNRGYVKAIDLLETDDVVIDNDI